MGGQLSPKAQKRMRESQTRRKLWQSWAEDGPYLQGNIICVPSPYFKDEAGQCWKAHGFIFHPVDGSDQSEWWRDTRRPLRGKRYAPDAWLKAARRRYFEFYPKSSKNDQGRHEIINPPGV